MSNLQKPPGVTSTERLSHRFSRRISPGKEHWIFEQIHYIIFGTSRQEAYFLYLFGGQRKDGPESLQLRYGEESKYRRSDHESDCFMKTKFRQYPDFPALDSQEISFAL